MTLFKAILEANQRLGSDRKAPLLDVPQFRGALPLAALTCIDARLNHLLPDVLGVPESEFIWLRNSGNIILDPMSMMMRTLALACAVKGGREIVIIGHTDCHVRKTSMMELTDRLKALGIERSRLPENLHEFFGLFASERQNVMKACETIRSSPLIGPKIPVHGLLVDIETGRLEWVVNGYETFVTASAPITVGAAADELGGTSGLAPLPKMAGFDMGEMKFPEMKIGELAGDVKQTIGTAEKLMTELKHRDLVPAWQTAKDLAAEVKEAARDAREVAHQARQVARDVRAMQPAELFAILSRTLDESRKYRIIGSDQKQYGPVSGAKLLDWLAGGLIGSETAVQMDGSKGWQKLSELAAAKAHKLPLSR